MARLNHGCSGAFNSVYHWRDNEGVLVVHALKPIRKGQVRKAHFVERQNYHWTLQELLTTYRDTKRPRNERRYPESTLAQS
jgi:hypothetical protein